MDKPIIEVENLSKLYRLGLIGATSLRDSVERWWYRMRRKEEMCKKVGAKHLMIEPDDPQAGPEPNTLWALKDISFSVQKGEIVGIIGRNGVGKSTLLKILSRITEPTKGRAIMRGRVSSLLEVGTGFHPELTGRENIYLNGAILGMRKAEIDRKFDEIVDFSGVEKFIDTPVKRYSSGMYVRLAFAVAAHLEPEILLVDEVLAVGDFEFQKKCLGKMGDVAKEGRTVLFVSHNMAAINTLCTRTILLDNARVIKIGNTSDIVLLYLMEKTTTDSAEVTITKVSNAEIAFTKIWISDIDGNVTNNIDIKKPFKIWLEYLVRKPNKKAEISIFIRNSIGVNVLFSSISDSLGNGFYDFKPGKYKTSILVNADFLIPDRYFLKVGAAYRGVREIDVHEDILSFEILETGSVMAPYGNAAKSLCCVLGGTKWELYNIEPLQPELTEIRDGDS